MGELNLPPQGCEILLTVPLKKPCEQKPPYRHDKENVVMITLVSYL